VSFGIVACFDPLTATASAAVCGINECGCILVAIAVCNATMVQLEAGSHMTIVRTVLGIVVIILTAVAPAVGIILSGGALAN